jgi:hypothetical protein
VVLQSPDFPKMKFNQFLVAPYFGPGLLPHEQTLWIDELVVGTRRLGPIKGRGTNWLRPKAALGASCPSWFKDLNSRPLWLPQVSTSRGQRSCVGMTESVIGVQPRSSAVPYFPDFS